ncbi:SDR family NAD(P)-dependent oxidoreductase [Virgisporangium ochraceum]|uniref:SDR family NAD(P)-dependent oxidoreductase n=1 Tax=Virgisporangium ochraceum TaxID=65505 RepID=UPI001EF384F8|nr:SDR family NAD(P)-dependent oxidoreductase [Virgisporangium ochraceum]
MDRTMLMTGASRGIGRHAAEHMLRADPDLHLIVVARGRDTATLPGELAAASGNRHVRAIGADLASLADVRAVVAEVTAALDAGTTPPLYGLVANAGIQRTSTTEATSDGFETTFAVNVLANYLLVRLLADRFTAPGRIVVTSSDTHAGAGAPLVPKARWADVATLARPGTGPTAASATEGRRAYSTSKLGVIYLVHALARRLPAGVDAYAFNPGLVPGTDLARDAGPVTRGLFRALAPVLTLLPFAQRARDAGDQLAAAATGPRPGDSGAYLDRSRAGRSSPESYDPVREEALWRDCASLVGLPADQPA